MCVDIVSLPNVSRYGDISIYRCISIVAIIIMMLIRMQVIRMTFLRIEGNKFLVIHPQQFVKLCVQ